MFVLLKVGSEVDRAAAWKQQAEPEPSASRTNSGELFGLEEASELGRDDVGVVLGPVVVESGWDDAAGGVGGSGRGSELFGRGSQGSEAVIAKQYELGTEGIAQLLSTERIAQFARMAVGD